MIRLTFRRIPLNGSSQLHRVQAGILTADAAVNGQGVLVHPIDLQTTDHRNNILLRNAVFSPVHTLVLCKIIKECPGLRLRLLNYDSGRNRCCHPIHGALVRSHIKPNKTAGLHE